MNGETFSAPRRPRWCLDILRALSTCSAFPWWLKIVIPFIRRNLFPLSYLELVAFLGSLIPDLSALRFRIQIARVDDTEPEGGGEEGRGGREHGVSETVDQFSPDIDRRSISQELGDPVSRLSLYSAKPVRSRGEVPLSGYSVRLVLACRRGKLTGPYRRGMLPPPSRHNSHCPFKCIQTSGSAQNASS